MTPTGIKPATFRIVAQCPNQLLYRSLQYSLIDSQSKTTADDIILELAYQYTQS